MSAAIAQSAGVAARRLAVAAAMTALASFSAQADDLMQQGKKLFLSGAMPACAVCHTLADAGSAGEIGPVLDELKPDAARVEKAVRNGLGIMPANKNLTDEQIRLLAQYVATASGGVKR